MLQNKTTFRMTGQETDMDMDLDDMKLQLRTSSDSSQTSASILHNPFYPSFILLQNRKSCMIFFKKLSKTFCGCELISLPLN